MNSGLRYKLLDLLSDLRRDSHKAVMFRIALGFENLALGRSVTDISDDRVIEQLIGTGGLDSFASAVDPKQAN